VPNWLNLLWWLLTAAACLIIAGVIGSRVEYIDPNGALARGKWWGILVDDRLRFSLTHLQVVLWTLVLLSLYGAVLLSRALHGLPPSEWLDIAVPEQLLILAGISGGSAVVATAAKSTRTAQIRAMNLSSQKQTHFSQMFFVEEGAAADQVIDVTKFQGFFFTAIAVLVYIVASAFELAATSVPRGLPELTPGLVWLIGISQAAYVGGKFPQHP
jgi:hypothetical protein